MGIEIHLFVEYDYSDGEVPFSDPGSIRPFNQGELFWWRDPKLFKAMGWVHPEEETEPVASEAFCLVPSRGLPEHYSNAILNRFFYIVDDRGYTQGYHPSLGSVRAEVAQKWLKDGIAISGPPLSIARGRGTEQLPRVSNPTWKRPSWLTMAEFGDSIRHAGLTWDALKPEVGATLELMKCLEAQFGQGHVRIVYWFDS